MQTLFVFSHLSWDFVFQRPQQLMSRLARHYRIFFIEEPPPGTEHEQDWQLCQPLLQLTVLRQPAASSAASSAAPSAPSAAPSVAASSTTPSSMRSPASMGSTASPSSLSSPASPLLASPVSLSASPSRPRSSGWLHTGALRERLAELAGRHPHHLAWLHTPGALPLLDALDPETIVYDCMDELSAFLDPPPGLLAQEQSLFAHADLVFAGGPSLYAAKRCFHPHVYCFPSSVDVTHFRQSLDRNIAHPAFRALPGPKLGFFGVLDERFDGELVAALADSEPTWQLVLVGPVAKIDPSQLPRRSNIHYTGQQPYAALPSFLASWDVCLLPFALNDATRFISPTKSLEYMAAELPVVSTAVPDVVSQHADVIAIAHTPDEFISHCRQALAQPAGERQRLIRRMREKLAITSWDATTDAMRRLLREHGRTRAGIDLGGAG